MASVEILQASFNRFEREQKIRDNGLRRSFDILTNEIKRLQKMVGEQAERERLPLSMNEFIVLMTTMLNRQQQLLTSIDEQGQGGTTWQDEDEDTAFVTEPGGRG